MVSDILNSKDFEQKRDELFEKLRVAEGLDEDLEREIENVYGKRGEKAVKVVKSNGVRKEGEKWFVEGSEEEYEVVRTFCSCKDYVLNIAPGKADVDMCYHALAKNIYKLLKNNED